MKRRTAKILKKGKITEAHADLQNKRIRKSKILVECNRKLEGQMKLNTVQGRNKCPARLYVLESRLIEISRPNLESSQT